MEMRTFSGVAGVLLGLTLLVSTAQAGTLLVPQQYATIQAAVNAAVAGDVIVIAAGVYTDTTHPAGGGDLTLCSVVMKSNITLRGAGMGSTIIDAGAIGRGISFFQATGCHLSDLTVRNAYSADGIVPGVYLRESQATLQRLDLSHNLYGAIVIAEGSDLTMLDCIMDSNVGKAGAGLDVEINCTAYVYNCDITNNEGPTTGGVLLRGDVTMEHCRIDNNAATGSAGVMGGGIGVLGGSPTLRYCTITDNVSGGNGGGIYFTGDTTFGLLENCLIANNHCDGDEGLAGGIGASSFASPTLRNCVVTNNSTTGQWSDGGGVSAQSANLVMDNCTLYANAVGGTTYTGGNLAIAANPTLNTVTVTNTIIAGATSGAGVSCTWGAEVVNISCTDVWGNAGGNAVPGTGTNNFSADPVFCDAAGGNFHIDEISPCAPGNHPGGAGLCGGELIGAKPTGCDSGVDGPPLQARTRLLGNRPNPFESSTVIAFVLSRDSDVRLEVVDLSGRRVATLQQGQLAAGEHHVAWDGNREDGTRAASGVYFYRLTAGGESQGMRMLHLD
jgi:predicted outer membrane repeat protein